MIIDYFKKIPPSVSVPVFYGFVLVGFTLRFLFATVFGALILVVGIYFYIEYCTTVSPFNSIELVTWIISLEAGYKIALLSSSVTIVGFVVAFHTATINWRNQMRAQLKVQAAGEIENFFAAVSRNITTADLYVKSLIETVNEIQAGASLHMAYFSVDYAQKKAGEFEAARNLLIEASIEVHRLIGRNHNLLASSLGLLSALKMAAKSLESITSKIWVHIPIVNPGDPNRAQEFVDRLDIPECKEFLDACENNYGKINGITGGIRGYLLSPVWGASFPMLVNLIAMRNEFKVVVQEFHEKLNADPNQ